MWQSCISSASILASCPPPSALLHSFVSERLATDAQAASIVETWSTIHAYANTTSIPHAVSDALLRCPTPLMQAQFAPQMVRVGREGCSHAPAYDLFTRLVVDGRTILACVQLVMEALVDTQHTENDETTTGSQASYMRCHVGRRRRIGLTKRRREEEKIGARAIDHLSRARLGRFGTRSRAGYSIKKRRQ